MSVLVPAYAKLHDYVDEDYMQHVRDSVGQSDSPGGRDYYAFRVRESTTTDYTPEEIHEIGKREAERIYAEMEGVRDEVGFEGTMAEFFERRYSRSFRVFAGIIAFGSGLVNFGIFPAVGAKFFIYFCGLPTTISLFGWPVETYVLGMVFLLAVSLFFSFFPAARAARMVPVEAIREVR